ncbi:putative RNA polymerase IIA largest subunit [Trypanosoma cruzi]|uniref:DNA-directed RNA polymerase subunit n=3 Tax=Trypanosoma cruzi TaxID=5693 RepID=A0A2V2W1V0_TRYCR|nr:putative RNA polymerase IIA largest subunit [Trypanosoma cruzi]
MSGGAPLPPSQMDLQKVVEVQFEMFKEKQIKDYAVCLVEHAKSYERGQPVRGGINDLRMGTTDFEFACETCHRKHPECPGHFGYIDLAEPVFNIGVFDIVLQVLKCVCKSCGALLMDTNDPQVHKKLQHLTGVNRLRQVVKMCGMKCRMSTDATTPEEAVVARGCGATQPRIGRYLGIYPTLIIKATLEEQDMVWHADTARQVLDRVSDEDARVMGFDALRCHPRDLVLTVLPVPPPQVRPAISFGSLKSDDELTHQIMSIVKRNNQLRKDKESDVQVAVDRSRALLQEHVAAYFNNASMYYKPTKVNDTKKLKSLTERLKGKYGRLRGNLMGKRVDFSARTVITGDPNIDVDEVGVPFSIAMTLTFPERVSAVNKKRLTEFVRRPVYPSANYIHHPNGTTTKLALRRDRSKVTLNIGDVVERHVINGDVVLFNRQPTLHRMSMMGHRVRVLNYNTFRLNLSCTTPYNADFDGDEMNLHVPQSLLTKAELIEMMMVPKNFVSPNKSAPCMGIVQDSLLGSYRLTDKDTFLDKYFVQSVALWLDLWQLPVPAVLKPRPLWTGKQVFSLILPEVNHPATPQERPPFPHNDSSIMIRRGQLLCGPITKGIVGAAPGSLIHVIFNERGSDEVARFINGVQRITTFFLINFGFSVGVQDTVADADTLRQMNEVLVKTRENVEKIGAAANNRTLNRKAGMTLLQSFEADVNSALNKCREEAAKKALSNVRRTNSFKVMIEAGSKGTDLNICQIAVFVGQQNVAGSRIPFGFRRRTLPHFMLDDYGETSRGMANRGYVEGLKPHEFFFHTMAGREGLIDTAVKTSDTGYLQRKLIKALEDVHAAYDGTVRNANQELIQFMYGEDGLDGARIEGGQLFPLPFRDNKEMESTYKYEYDETGAFNEKVGGAYMDPHVKKMLRADPENVRKLQSEFDQLMADRDWARQMMDLEEREKLKLNLPVNIGRLIQNARSTMGKRSQVSNLSPVTIIDHVRKLQEDMLKLFPCYHKGVDGRIHNLLSRQRIENALTLFSVHLRQLLASKRVLREYKLNDKAFEYLLKEIRTKYLQSLVSPGENIGAIAAQSCGEPATQMTLNTFHNAGISSKNVTLGVPRLLELLNVSRHQKHASMNVSLYPPWDKKRTAQQAQHLIEYCTLESVTKRIQFIYDPDPRETVVEADRAILELEWSVMDESDERARLQEVENGSPWIARLELDADMFVDKALNMKDVKQAILRVDDGYVIETGMANDTKERTIRMRPKKNDGVDSIPRLKHAIPELLARVHLRGIPGVRKALLKDRTTFTVDPATGKMKGEKTWLIDTDGTALRRAFIGIVDEKGNNIINATRTSSNKVPEVCSLLGIEAARYKMLHELREAYLAYGLNINYRHYTILVDTICQRGYLMAVSRVGINRSEMSGPLMRCSFEETVKVLMAAAAFGERDPVRGVSANLVLGNQARIGTGLFDLVLNMAALQQAVPQEDAVAPGKEVNVYHGLASTQNLPSSMPYRAKDHEATPFVNDASLFFREGVGGSSSAAPLTASTLYGGMHEASAVHFSQAYPAMGMLDQRVRASSVSQPYSVMSSASVYNPASMQVPSALPSSVDYSEASSFHIQSSMAMLSVPSSPQFEAPQAFGGGRFGGLSPAYVPSVMSSVATQPYQCVGDSESQQSASYVPTLSPAYSAYTARRSVVASRASASRVDQQSQQQKEDDSASYLPKSPGLHGLPPPVGEFSLTEDPEEEEERHQ